MPVPAHMWLKDGGDTDIKGSVDVQDREGSIAIMGFSHGLNIPVDSAKVKITATHSHSPMMTEKALDSFRPYLYKAISRGQTLKSTETRWYRISHAGQEEYYFVMSTEGVKITVIIPSMPNIKWQETTILTIWSQSH